MCKGADQKRISCAKEPALFDVQKSHHSSCKDRFCKGMISSKGRSLVQKSHHSSCTVRAKESSLFVQKSPPSSCKGGVCAKEGLSSSCAEQGLLCQGALTLRAKEGLLCKGALQKQVLLCKGGSCVHRIPHSLCKGALTPRAKEGLLCKEALQKQDLLCKRGSCMHRSPHSLCKGALALVQRRVYCAKEPI